MGADVSATDGQGNTALHLLVAPHKYGNPPSAGGTLSMMISKCPSTTINQTNQQGNSPLQLAARKHQWEAARLLLNAGADPLIPDSDRNSLLHHLAECLRQPDEKPRFRTSDPEEDLWPEFSGLLQRGLAINASNKEGETPIFHYVRALRSQPSLRGTLMDCLLAAGADVSILNNEGQSLLHVVAKIPVPQDRFGVLPKKLFVEAFTYLMELGLDPQHEDNKERTPVDIAAAYAHKDILALFKK
ncbi:ankyrin [Aspergillus ellipticus CBS 707.79]|uniref:Ankyrin n=1 Tax=Aspergillus ellipticus CBS 707.79 TaxID=1448320 RepID=A0A319D594_9EURO|nr:ankyrin [Aspergillus ellipticus CBS 707.79]